MTINLESCRNKKDSDENNVESDVDSAEEHRVLTCSLKQMESISIQYGFIIGEPDRSPKVFVCASALF